MNFSVLVLCFLFVSEATSQDTMSPTTNSLRKLPRNDNPLHSRIGKIMRLFRRTLSKLRPTKNTARNDPAPKILRNAISDIPLHRTTNDIQAKIHHLAPSHTINRKSMEELNSFENEVLSEENPAFENLSSYAILSHSQPSFAKVVLNNPNYKKFKPVSSAAHNNHDVYKPSSAQVPQSNVGIASGLTSSGPNAATSGSVIHQIRYAVPTHLLNNRVTFGSSNSASPSVIPDNSPSVVPNSIPSGSTVHQVKYIPPSFQMAETGTTYQIGVFPNDIFGSSVPSNSIQDNNYQGSIPTVQNGFYQGTSLTQGGSTSTPVVHSGTIYQMANPVPSGSLYQVPGYQISTSPNAIHYKPYLSHSSSKPKEQLSKPTINFSKNMYDKPSKSNSFIKQNMNKFLQTIYPYYHKPKFRYPYYDKEGNGKLLYGFGTPKLYEYNVFRPLGGYMRR